MGGDEGFRQTDVVLVGILLYALLGKCADLSARALERYCLRWNPAYLDALTRIEMQQLIERLWQARGFSAVLMTHDVQEAVALADRVILIEDGAVTLDMPVDLPRPRARGSAAFAALEQAALARVLHSQT